MPAELLGAQRSYICPDRAQSNAYEDLTALNSMYGPAFVFDLCVFVRNWDINHDHRSELGEPECLSFRLTFQLTTWKQELLVPCDSGNAHCRPAVGGLKVPVKSRAALGFRFSNLATFTGQDVPHPTLYLLPPFSPPTIRALDRLSHL
ncbi:unnamed protein product [Leptosia nina]|uniref:Uncharacterized protein n=1 Tax=Leptosia nina TaxID=320188 RepID=A0AAV1K290_9NEOP